MEGRGIATCRALLESSSDVANLNLGFRRDVRVYYKVREQGPCRQHCMFAFRTTSSTHPMEQRCAHAILLSSHTPTPTPSLQVPNGASVVFKEEFAAWEARGPVRVFTTTASFQVWVVWKRHEQGTFA